MQVDENGLVTGGPEPAVLRQAQSEKLPVMPIVGLFNKAKFHLLATNPAAQAQMNEALIRECKLHGYVGFQFDLENVSWTDRDALIGTGEDDGGRTAWRGTATKHRDGAECPGLSGQRRVCEMDLHRLARRLRSCGPGQISGPDLPDDLRPEHALDDARAGGGLAVDSGQPEICSAVCPKGKALAGHSASTDTTGMPALPLIVAARRSQANQPTEKPNPTGDYIGAPDAELLARDWGGTIQWDADDHTAWFYINRDQMREWVFFTDLRTFRDRYDLAQQYGLEGFCSWVLGQEDPQIWTVLPQQRQLGSERGTK